MKVSKAFQREALLRLRDVDLQYMQVSGDLIVAESNDLDQAWLSFERELAKFLPLSQAGDCGSSIAEASDN